MTTLNKKMLIHELKPGLFVEALDRPWLDTPYLIQGFQIQSQADIDELARHCQYVYVSSTEKPHVNVAGPRRVHIIPEVTEKKTPFHGQFLYPDKKNLEEALPEAKVAHQTALALMDRIKVGIHHEFKLNLDAATELVSVITASIVDNPDAMLLLKQMKAAKGDQYEHAINSSIHMIAFGRHLCLPTEELAHLGLGGLLMDVGLLKLPTSPETLSLQNNEDPLPDHPPKIMEQHVLLGEKMLSTMPGIPESVIQITAQHHEREDGSGYPKGLCGNEITPYARMAAIVDNYDKMTTQGISTYHPAMSPFDALNMLWDWTRRWLNATLVQQFAHCIGLFPVGSLVELNSGEVAVVLTHNRTKRFQPRVMVVLVDKKPIDSPWMLDLSAQKTLNPNGVPYEIVRELPATTYKLDPSVYYL